jgi:hypothetical protein
LFLFLFKRKNKYFYCSTIGCTAERYQHAYRASHLIRCSHNQGSYANFMSRVAQNLHVDSSRSIPLRRGMSKNRFVRASALNGAQFAGAGVGVFGSPERARFVQNTPTASASSCCLDANGCRMGGQGLSKTKGLQSIQWCMAEFKVRAREHHPSRQRAFSPCSGACQSSWVGGMGTILHDKGPSVLRHNFTASCGTRADTREACHSTTHAGVMQSRHGNR